MEINECKKKRKINDDEEEADIQKFFALIDNIREARQRLMNGSGVVLNAARMDHNDGNRSNRKKKTKVMEEEKEKDKEKSKQLFNGTGPAVICKPSLIYQREDLQEEAQFKIPTSQNSREGEKEDIKCNLDLTLSL